jgi:hypothetical protein
VRAIIFVLIGLLALLVNGCGGSSTPTQQQKPNMEFGVISGNWNIPISPPSSANPFLPTASAGGSLTQTGNTITGILHVNGSPCFDPLADELIVSGTGSNDNSFTVTLNTAPVRGQAISVNAEWDAATQLIPVPGAQPTGPVAVLRGEVTVSGGACAGTIPDTTTRLQILSLDSSSLPNHALARECR